MRNCFKTIHFQHHIQAAKNETTNTATPEYTAIHWGTSNKQDAATGQVNVATQATAESQNPDVRVFPMPVGFSKPEIVRSIEVTDEVNQQTQEQPIVVSNDQHSVPVTNPTVAKTIHVVPSAFAKAFEANPHLFKSKEHNDVAKQFTNKEPIIVTETITQPAVVQVTTSTTTLPPVTTLEASQLHSASPLIDRPTQLISSIPEPIDGLQPPHYQFKTYDDSTTEGPPIYYQWKWAVPAFVLEPPKLNDPQGK